MGQFINKMWFKKKIEQVEQTEHKRYCPRCQATDDLIVYTKRKNLQGVMVLYYICKPCNRIRVKKYYDAGNQKRFIEANKRYLAKKK